MAKLENHPYQCEEFDSFVAAFKKEHPELRGGRLVQAYRRAWLASLDKPAKKSEE